MNILLRVYHTVLSVEDWHNMQNVKLEKAKRGWFLTIGDDDIYHRWAVSSEELWCVQKVINDNMVEIMKEIEVPKS